MNAGSMLHSARKAEREGDKLTAAEFYRRVIQEFPASKEASAARLDLEELGPVAKSEPPKPDRTADAEPPKAPKNVRTPTVMKKNKISRVSLMGGLIGALATNPRAALQSELDKQNQQGWNAVHIDPHGTTNLFIRILQLVVLIITLGLFTWGGGYLLLFEKEQ